MQLPGGIATGDNQVRTQGWIKAIDGRLELELWEICSEDGSRIDCIDRIIDTVMLFEDGPVRAADLSTGDRQFIMARLARHFTPGLFWKSIACCDCESLYDISIDLDRVPVTPAGSSYPFTRVRIDAGDVDLRVPNGADQAMVAHIEDPMEAVAALAQRCIVTPGFALSADPETCERDLAAIDAALQAVAPQVATTVASLCPDCGAENETAFDTASQFFESVFNPLPEFHDIAMAYHWSEAEIQALPRTRRRAYLALIDSESGTVR